MQSDFPWFSHDSEARNSRKLRVLRSSYGTEGYAWYFMLLEILRTENDFRLNLAEEFTLSYVLSDLGMEEKQFDSFVKSCCSLRLFRFEDGLLWSEGLRQRLQKHELNRMKWRANGMKGGRPKTKSKPKQNQRG